MSGIHFTIISSFHSSYETQEGPQTSAMDIIKIEKCHDTLFIGPFSHTLYWLSYKSIHVGISRFFFFCFGSLSTKISLIYSMAEKHLTTVIILSVYDINIVHCAACFLIFFVALEMSVRFPFLCFLQLLLMLTDNVSDFDTSEALSQ